ncbi:MAG: hypothetical protein BKP49_07670 [Treponema sp. CETP13]|nr:MAG: hypothetical protein BKP49_07670 [Treponema sp. CETP13]
MTRLIQKVILFSIFLFLSLSVWAQTVSMKSENSYSIDDLLQGYLDNNIDLKDLQLDVEQAQADLDEILITYGINVNVSTGSSSLTLSDDSTEMTSSPSVTLTIPDANNTTITATTPLTVTVGDDTQTYLDDAGVSVSTEIISSTANGSELLKEEYERYLKEAKQAVETKKISLQSDFWEEVSDLYTADKTMKEDSDDLYDNQIDFETIIAKGYSKTSSTYRTAELEVKESEFTVQKDQRDLTELLDSFAVACGYKPGDLTEVPAIDQKYNSIELISFEDYEKENFIDLENVIWDHEYNERLRAADSNFTLSVDAGYGYSAYIDSSDDDSEAENELSAGVTAGYKGLTTSVGLSSTIEDFTSPSLTFSFSYDFASSKLEDVYDIEDEIDDKREQLDIEDAIESWEDYKQTAISDKATLEWTRAQNAEQLELYKEMYEDSIVWYEKGIISKTDFLQAKNSYETNSDDSILTIIDCIIYNLDIEKLFIGDK